LIITLSDGKAELKLYYTCYENEDAIVRRAEITNISEEPFKIESIMSAQIDLPMGDLEIITLYGAPWDERNMVRLPLGKGERVIDSKDGSSSHQQNPFVALLSKFSNEEQGEVYGFNLVYSGSYVIKVEESNVGTTRLLAGINDFNFSWTLNSQEKFSTPELVFVYSSDGLNKMSQSFHDLYRNYLIPEKYAFAKRPILLNSWESCYFDFDNKKICELIEKAATLGIDTFVLDDGWFGKRNDDKTSLGDWFVNEDKLKGGLDTIISCCQKNGMNFGLWIEPEMISEESNLYREHPDWAIATKDRIYCRQRNQLVLDLSNPKVLEYLKKTIAGLLGKYNISYVKWDMNRTITEYYSMYLPIDKQKELMHRYILGVYELAEYLTSEFSNVFFEGCASGGGRFDPAMLYYFPQFWASDNTDAIARQRIQYGTSLCYPLSAMSGHVSICPNHQTKRSTPLKTRCDIASLCSTGYELNLELISKEDAEAIKMNISRYKEIEDLILCGDLYRIDNPFESEYFAEIVVSKNKEKAFAVCGKRLYKHRAPIYYFKLKGLKENTYYKIKETSEIYHGSVLLNIGIPVTFKNDFETLSFTLEQEKEMLNR
jgi:alpha-galactosidase